MDDLFNAHDLLHVGTLAIAVAILWTQQKASQRWQDKHESQDAERFDAHQRRLDQLADRERR